MRSLKLMLAAAAVAGAILAPTALAKKKPKCPPGSDAPEYCQSDPGWGGEHEHGDARRHHRHHHDQAVRPAR